MYTFFQRLKKKIIPYLLSYWKSHILSRVCKEKNRTVKLEMMQQMERREQLPKALDIVHNDLVKLSFKSMSRIKNTLEKASFKNLERIRRSW